MCLGNYFSKSKEEVLNISNASLLSPKSLDLGIE